MAELKQDPSQALLSLLYPLLGGEANVASITRRGNRISAQLKDESLAAPQRWQLCHPPRPSA